MSLFLDLRYAPVGGDLASQVNAMESSATGEYQSLPIAELQSGVCGRHVLLATHGYNVDRAAGIASLSNWEQLLRLAGPAAFVGVLWPGDSTWAHGLDYPGELSVADRAGAMLAEFLDSTLQQAASLSFASHSLEARVVLSTIRALTRRVRRLTLMAGAVDDNCLSGGFAAAAGKVERISALASRKDTVLSRLFPLGNFAGSILDVGHPWWRAALGHAGPSRPWPGNFVAPFELPDGWAFNHGNYLEMDAQPVPVLTLPVDAPPQGTEKPGGGQRGWQEAFTAGFESTRFE